MFENFMNILLQIFVVVISIRITKIYFAMFFESKKGNVYGGIGWFLYCLWQFSSNWLTKMPSYYKVFVTASLIFIVSLGSYQGSKIKKVTFSILLTAIWMLIELLTGYLFIGFGVDYQVPKRLGAFLSTGVTLALICMLKKFFEEESIKEMSSGYSILFITVPIGSMFVIYNFFMISSRVYNRSYIDESIVGSVIIIIINIIVFRMYIKIAEAFELKRYNTVYVQQLELYKKYTIEKEEALLEARKNRHDIKQHYIVLIKMLENKKYNDCMMYLENLLDTNRDESHGIAKTDNIIVDSLVNAKYLSLKKSGVKFEINLHVPMQLPFENADLSIVLGNILDNAIEATDKVQGGYINLSMNYEKNALFILMKNSFTGKLAINKDGEIATNKQDTKNHGIGLKSVKKIVEKYHGALVVKTMECDFITQISMYHTDKSCI